MPNPENLTISRNLRAAFADQDKEWQQIAAEAGYSDKTALSRVVAGRVGITEAKLLALATALGVEPGKLLAGVSDRTLEKYPNVNPGYRNKARQLSGMAVTNVATLIKDTPQSNALLSHFFGGLTPDQLPKFREILQKLADAAKV